MAETAPRPQTNTRGQRQGGGRRGAPAEPKEYQELVINIDRVARVVKGGRRFRFKALVVVGNDKNKVGIGVAKGADVQAAIAKATDVAKKHIINIATDKDTIPHDCEIQFSGARVMMKPASPGTGIIAGGVVRSIIGVTGIRDILTKSLGSTNKVNIAYATIEALRNQVAKSEWLNATPAKPVVVKTVEKTPAVKKVAKEASPTTRPPKLDSEGRKPTAKEEETNDKV